MKRAAAATVLLAALAGCAPRLGPPPGAGRPVDPAPWAARLAAYNAGPESVRVSGVLRVRGRGAAEFGARAARTRGFRLDAVAGPFGSPVLALACRAGGECEAFFPRRNRLYRGPAGGWDVWLGSLLRGRVPVLGPAEAAWTAGPGRTTLRLRGEDGWRQEVGFGPEGRPEEVLLVRRGRVEARVELGEPLEVDGRPFPRRVVVTAREPAARYEIEFHTVVSDGEIPAGVLTLAAPPGVAVETVGGTTTWSDRGVPFWLPVPDG